MIPGEIITKSDEIVLNKDSDTLKIKVSNTGDRPIQVGSHYHFYETNEFLSFDRDKTKRDETRYCSWNCSSLWTRSNKRSKFNQYQRW